VDVRTAGSLVLLALLAPASQPQRMCGRVVSIHCSGLSSAATLTVRTDREREFQVTIGPEHRAAFGLDIEATYEFRNVCVTPRAARDGKAVVQAPEDLEITSQPARPLPPVPPGVYRACEADIENPVPTKAPHPRYPREAFQERIQGAVRLRVIVNADGTAGDIVVIDSLSRDLDNAAVEAVRTWRFTPARLKGQPVAVVAFLEMSFHLR
jgi:TonB family protein